MPHAAKPIVAPQPEVVDCVKCIDGISPSCGSCLGHGWLARRTHTDRWGSYTYYTAPGSSR